MRHRLSLFACALVVGPWAVVIACGRDEPAASPVDVPVGIAPKADTPASPPSISSMTVAPTTSAPPRELTPEEARAQALKEAQEFGMIGLYELADGGGEGIGLGTISGGYGLGDGGKTSRATVRQGATAVNGRLPPEVIQRIVRQNLGRFRYCYEKSLMKIPDLKGRITVKFVIGKSGSVTSARDDGSSDLPDAAAIACVVRTFASLSFPQPEGGDVTVVYPLTFSPGDAAPASGVKPSKP